MPILSDALQSGSILLREGLEALLVISALAAFLQRSGAAEKIRLLNWGAGAAILASFGMAAIFQAFYGGEHDDRIEAIVMIVAALLMFYMSGWLFLKQDPRRWQAEIHAAANKALASTASVSLAAVAFLAVFREGGETVLFLHALAKTSGGWNAGLVLGLAVAAALLVVLYVAIRTFAMRLPLRPVFLVTSGFLFIMALRFLGGAIKEMQEMQLVGNTPLEGFGWLADWGLNDSIEALAIMLVIALIAAGGTALAHFRRPSLPVHALAE